MKRTILIAAPVLIVCGLAAWYITAWRAEQERLEEDRYRRQETELVLSKLPGISVELYRAGNDLRASVPVSGFTGTSLWLSKGDYFLKVIDQARSAYLPVSLTGFRCGPDEEGSFLVSIRPLPEQLPPRLSPGAPAFVYIPAGNVLIGDRLNPKEPHYVWLTGYFIAPFEVTNGEFRKFLQVGYDDPSCWSTAGRRWKSSNRSRATARLSPADADYPRFGRDDLPVVWITWFEANAYCTWLTKTLGNRWLFSLPNDAEWEKAARGPDDFEYALGRSLSDAQIGLYNWRKNPDAPVPVVGVDSSRTQFAPNRFGLYHMTGNVSEWSQSVNMPYNREHPFADDERNATEADGLRSVRGGSWYSAAISYLMISYRDSFQPEHSNQELGFRVVAKALP